LQIRSARSPDIAALRDLVQRAYEHYVERIGMRPVPMDADYDAAVREGRTWVADDGGEVVGLLVLETHAEHLEVENLAVDPARQGQGIGRALMAFAEQRAGELGLDQMRLHTHAKMTENQAIYARLGYREYERRTVDGREGVFMSKRLGQ
jgi:ribosomal protein S18 acetylase RimI-like enzyme